MEHTAGPIYEFGRHRYDAAQRLLFRDGSLVPLTPKAVDMLHVLIERQGRIVEKGELLQLVWPDTTVEEVGLARNISLLRKALEAERSDGIAIETIPRRGYRFVAEVREVGAPDNGAAEAAPAGLAMAPRNRRRWLRPAIAALVVALAGGLVYWQFYRPSKFLTVKPGMPSMAVAPFECVGGGTGCGNVPQAIGDHLVTELVKLGGMSVVSPSTVRRHQRTTNSMSLMGRLLALDVLVEGTVQVTGGEARILSRLVDVHTGRLIWADGAVFPASDAGRMQDEARQMAIKVAAHLAIQQSFSQPGKPSR
jgi:DNA-binding winged helix-turn-helix (wHTH) protein/TolB-like protein